jgi:hypothetical protein
VRLIYPLSSFGKAISGEHGFNHHRVVPTSGYLTGTFQHGCKSLVSTHRHRLRLRESGPQRGMSASGSSGTMMFYSRCSADAGTGAGTGDGARRRPGWHGRWAPGDRVGTGPVGIIVRELGVVADRIQVCAIT